jgi:hypothetical protein
VIEYEYDASLPLDDQTFTPVAGLPCAAHRDLPGAKDGAHFDFLRGESARSSQIHEALAERFGVPIGSVDVAYHPESGDFSIVAPDGRQREAIEAVAHLERIRLR